MKRLVAALVAIVVCAGAQVAGSANAAAPAPLGVASIATLTDRTAAGYQAEAAAIRGVGASWIRIVMNWNETETAPGHFSWTRLDAAVAAARAANLQVLGLVEGPAPAWAATVPLAPNAPPRQASDYGAFARQLAARYRNTVHAWEIWNEPNIPAYWISPNAAAYVAVLRAAYTSIKQVAPEATVLSGGLSPDPRGISPTTFVKQMYAAGGGAYFDAIALHPYTFPYAARSDPRGRQLAVSGVRMVMDWKGQWGKKIWITEWGQATGTGPDSVNESAQASIIMSSLDYFQAKSRMGPLFLFTSKDWKTDPSLTEFNYGLYRYDYSPKPVVAQLKKRYGVA